MQLLQQLLKLWLEADKICQEAVHILCQQDEVGAVTVGMQTAWKEMQ